MQPTPQDLSIVLVTGRPLSSQHQIPRLFQILQVTSTWLYRLSATLSIQTETQKLCPRTMLESSQLFPRSPVGSRQSLYTRKLLIQSVFVCSAAKLHTPPSCGYIPLPTPHFTHCLQHFACYNNNNTNICKAHIVSIRAESEAPAVARWRGWLVVVV